MTAPQPIDPVQTVDGVSLAAGDRVLFIAATRLPWWRRWLMPWRKDQTNKTQNGIYMVSFPKDKP
jgi:hypothetical protein